MTWKVTASTSIGVVVATEHFSSWLGARWWMLVNRPRRGLWSLVLERAPSAKPETIAKAVRIEGKEAPKS